MQGSNMVKAIKIFAVVLLVVPGILSYDCSHAPSGNGNIEITCTSYVKCTNGIGIKHTCMEGYQAYDLRTGTCRTKTHVAPPCNRDEDCTNKANTHFAHLDTNCTAYYTCHNNGYFYGHNFCSPGLVFDERAQLCNWPSNVAAPCGTLLVG